MCIENLRSPICQVAELDLYSVRMALTKNACRIRCQVAFIYSSQHKLECVDVMATDGGVENDWNFSSLRSQQPTWHCFEMT